MSKMISEPKNEIKYYTKSEVLHLGFTDKLITALLPDPILKINPHYKSGPQMKLWIQSDVANAMKTAEFTNYQEQARKRREGAAKAVVTKETKLAQEVDKKIQQISVRIIDYGKLMQDTVQSKQDWYEYQAEMRESYDYRDASSADYATQQRWAVNYIRHELTEYDSNLYDMSGKVGCYKEYSRYKNAVLDKIAEFYPFLKDECDRQKTM